MFEALWRRREDGVARPIRTPHSIRDELVRVVALTRDADGWNALHAIAEAEKWILLWAHTAERAKELIVRYRARVVIIDRDLPNEDWRRVVSELGAMRPAVCTLLASQVADEYLWRELVQQGGFEILAKPFDRDRVARAIRFAASFGTAHA